MSSSSSCTPPNPVVIWGGGNAPSLQYNLPQGTVLSPLIRIPMNIDSSNFKASSKRPPDKNFFETTAALQVNDLHQNIINDLLQSVTNSKYIQNASSLANMPYKPILTTDGIISGQNVAGKGNALFVANKVGKIGEKAIVSNNSKLTKAVKFGSGELNEQTSLSLSPDKEVSVDFLVQRIKEGYKPTIRKTASGTTRMEYFRKPTAVIPQLYIIEEYRITNFLGNYGAGKIVNTMTLLPGEKTTISVRTFKQKSSTRSVSENVMESVSEEVVDELESFVQDERIRNNSSSSSNTQDFSIDVSVGCDFGFVSAGVDVGYASSSSSEQSRAEALNSIKNSLDRQTNRSNSQREITVNTTTQDTATEETEETITRTLENANYSRVLNFVFRQMTQEYVSLTSLVNIKVLYTNGYDESAKLVGIEKLDELLKAVIEPAFIDNVRATIINRYCKIKDYTGTRIPFLNNINETLSDQCVEGFTPEQINYWEVINQEDTYPLFSTLDVNVPGIIVNVAKRSLRTDHVLCDALLGQADALDCYGMSKQESESQKVKLENQMRNSIISAFDKEGTEKEKIEYAKMMERILTDCCSTSQSGGCCCGGNNSPIS